MAQARNTFIKSKLNKDLDARLMPQGEYRDALNVQVSKSEGSSVGSLENVLGTTAILDIQTTTGINNLICIGQLADESNGKVYLFLTNNTTSNFLVSSRNYIIEVTVDAAPPNNYKKLVEGPFLNFSANYKIYASNLLEDLLFWTDNYNQPRVINITLANPNPKVTPTPTYYTTEDQISVAKYNPYEAIDLWQASTLGGSGKYETTMKDVTSKALPNGGTGFSGNNVASPSPFLTLLTGFTGDLPASQNPQASGTQPTQNMIGNSGINYGGATVSYIDANGDIQPLYDAAPTYVYNWKYQAPQTGIGLLEGIADIKLASQPNGQTPNVNWPVTVNEGTEIVFNANPYYDKNFAGDSSYLEDKFVRFSYRFKFEDNEYSLMAPFTQIAFIPKQDGYFLYIKEVLGIQGEDSQTEAYRSSIVSFMENKADDIKLRVPLPETKATIANALKIKELEILYKESDALAVKIIDVITINELTQNPTVDSNFFVYNYISKKPIKTLTENQLTRVYDKIPVRAFSQEIASNRVVYGNFQNKHTPPAFLDYNVGVSPKYLFNLQGGSFKVTNANTYAAGATIAINTPLGTIQVGSYVTGTSGVPNETQITEVATNNSSVKLNKEITVGANALLTVAPVGDDTQSVSRIEYPNSTLKQNRTYQVGVVLSDKYGRSSTVILSSNATATDLGVGIGLFGGDTIYAPYLSQAINQNSWPGDSLKVLFNSAIVSPKNISLGIPGLYNGEVSSSDYNPLGWYSYKIVVKQTEQEYYNVYLPGIMAAYPEDAISELGKTSHVVLINDNINKIPRDLSEVGPQQKQFRSAVQLFGRVQNTNLIDTLFLPGANLKFPANVNDQYYPGKQSHTVSTISTLQDLFDYNPQNVPIPNNFPQFYALESNPLVARISTEKQIGQIATTNFSSTSAVVASTNFSGAESRKTIVTPSNITVTQQQGVISVNDIVTSDTGSIPENTYVGATATPAGSVLDIQLSNTVEIVPGMNLKFVKGFPQPNQGESTPPGIQYLSVYETKPVESLLDIFWETTSTGLISSLNNLILNSSGGSAGLSNINFAPWNEALTTSINSGKIFQNPVFFQDSFGASFTTQVQANTIQLVSVTDGNGLDVQGSNPYFALVQNSNGSFDIKITANYFNTVYFFEPNNVNERLFVFQVQAQILDSSGSTQTAGPFTFGPGGPANIAPSLPAVTGNPTPQNNATIKTNRTNTQPIATFYGVNGSGNPALRYNVTHSFESVINNTTNQNVTASNYFILDQNVTLATDANFPNMKRGQLKLGLGSIPADIYTIKINTTDGGGISQQNQLTYIVDLTIIPTQGKQGTFSCTNPDGSGGQNTANFVWIQISGSPTFNQNGFYLWKATSFVGAGIVNQSNVVTVDRTNAIEINPAACQSSDIPFFASSEQGVYNLLGSSDCIECQSGTYNPGNLQNIQNFSNYSFEIV